LKTLAALCPADVILKLLWLLELLLKLTRLLLADLLLVDLLLAHLLLAHLLLADLLAGRGGPATG
jgi:hypothetical protein